MRSKIQLLFFNNFISGGKNEERDTLEYILEWELHVARVELYRTAEYLEVYRLVFYCTTRNFQFNLNLGKQAQKNLSGLLNFKCAGGRTIDTEKFCIVLRTNESILRILGVPIN